MKKNTFLFWIIVLILTFILNSCGAKQKESSKKEDLSKIELSLNSENSTNSQEKNNQESNVNQISNTKIDEENQICTDDFTVEPIDPTKPSSYTDPKGNKHILDNAKMTNKKSNQQTKTKVEKAENIQQTQKSEIEKTDKEKSTLDIKIAAEKKKIELAKKLNQKAWQFPWWFWLIIAAVVLLILIYLNKRFQWIKYVTAFVVKLFQIRKK